METNKKKKSALPMCEGDFVDLYTSVDGKRYVRFIANVEEYDFSTLDFDRWKDHDYLRIVEPVRMKVELGALKKRFSEDGDIYVLMAEFGERSAEVPLTKKEFRSRMAETVGIADISELLGGGLPDGRWFIPAHYAHPDIEEGDFVDLYTGEDGKRYAHFCCNVYEADDFDGFKSEEPCGMEVELGRLRRCLKKDGNIYDLMAEFDQYGGSKVSKKEFSLEMSGVKGTAIIADLLKGKLPDGYWFIHAH